MLDQPPRLTPGAGPPAHLVQPQPVPGTKVVLGRAAMLGQEGGQADYSPSVVPVSVLYVVSQVSNI